MRAYVVEKRIYYVTSRRSICVPLDGHRDVINHDEHDEYGDADIKRLACECAGSGGIPIVAGAVGLWHGRDCLAEDRNVSYLSIQHP